MLINKHRKWRPMGSTGAGDFIPSREAPSGPQTTHYKKNIRGSLPRFPAFGAMVKTGWSFS